jgi:hypothetical protein
MAIGVRRVALWAFVGVLLLILVSSALPTARAGPSPNYTLQGFAETSTGVPVHVGTTVWLISQATHQIYTTTTTSASGAFSFTLANTGNALAPGWWGVQVPGGAYEHLTGCNPCAVLPQVQQPTYYYENATALTTGAATYARTITGVNEYGYLATVFGNLTYASSGGAAGSSTVDLVNTLYDGSVFANATTNSSGGFVLKVPAGFNPSPEGKWVLRSNDSSPVPLVNFTGLSTLPPGGVAHVRPTLQNYIAYGRLFNANPPNVRVPNGGNVTIVDTSNLDIYSTTTPPGFYDTGLYPGNFVGPGSSTFDVIVSPVGYGTVYYPITVGPSFSGVSRDLYVPPTAPPAQYNTTLDFSSGLGKVTVTTVASLANDSTFQDLPNATVGQLWAQLGLDFQGSLSYSPSSGTGGWSAFVSWLNNSGPFFPMGQAGLSVNGTTFGQALNWTLSSPSPGAGPFGLSSATGATATWTQASNVTGFLAGHGLGGPYTIHLNFRHPTNEQAINYTVKLPPGFVLQAGNKVPTGSYLVPVGTTWNTFTLVSRPVPASGPQFGQANFTVLRAGTQTVTANVNVTVSNFTWTTANVLNSTHGNYTAIVGVGENATFSALNSTYPAGTNGSRFAWTFGDGTPTFTTSSPTWGHTFATAGTFHGTLAVTSSAGAPASVAFTIIASDATPVPAITSNATAAETHTAGGSTYVMIDWGTTLHFNATGTKTPCYAGATVNCILSVSIWNASASGGEPHTNANYSSGAGLSPFSNLTIQFLGGGHYLSNTTIGTTVVPFLGWQYNVTLTAWDGGGHMATTTLPVLVKDTQKPSPAPIVQNSKGKPIAASGIVEGSNQTAEVLLYGANSTDPNNGSIVSYNWSITDSQPPPGFHAIYRNVTSPGPLYKKPGAIPVWLPAVAKPYAVNLTVTDRAGNKASSVVSLTVQPNATLRPVLVVGNLTAPGSMTDQSTYTIWCNVTNTVGKNSTATNVVVGFYLLPNSGVGTPIYIGGSTSSVKFYNVTNGTVGTTPIATGSVNLPYNKTVRAEISFTPARTGDFQLYANATASNEFYGDYVSGANLAHVGVTLKVNPTVQAEEYGAIAVAAVVVIVALILYLRQRSGRPISFRRTTKTTTTTGRSGLERGRRTETEEEEEEEET